MATMPYHTHVSTTKDTAENFSDEFSTNIPRFINRAELRLTREIDNLGLTKYVSSNFTAGDAFLTKPSDALIIKNINFTKSNGSRVNLVHRTNEYLTDYWPARTSTGTPRYYSNFGANRVLIAPAPVSALDVEMSYVGRPEALASSTNETNYFTEKCSNALFYAVMVEACFFMKNDGAAIYWENQYNREKMDLLNESRRTRRDDMEIPSNPGGGEDNMIKGQA